MITLDADVAVLGSGFAGSITTLILHRLGLRPVLIDRTAHPRFTIGESSTPIADMILRDLADAYDLPRIRPLSTYGTWQATYPHLRSGLKRGFSYFHHEPLTPFTPNAGHTNELLVAASTDDATSDTQWYRADVDAFFADEVREAGVPFFENTQITSLRREDGWHLWGLFNETPLVVDASFVIDATGSSGVVARALGFGASTPLFRTHSRTIYGHFSGLKPWHDLLVAQGGVVTDHPFCCDHAALHHILDGAWMWQLRFNTDVVSAGLVLDTRRHPLDETVAPRDEWTAWLGRYPSLQEQFADAALADPPGRLIRTGRLQRRASRAAGPNWAALPFTAGFVDPLHSTGIAHALSGIERLAGLLARHWNTTSLPDALHDYETALFRELDFLDKLVAACYASFGSFERFAVSTMLYFAAVISYERRRYTHPAADPFPHLFLCADEEPLVRAVDDALKRLAALETETDTDAAYARFVEAAIAPYNTAGLFHPRVPNMYHHTAAPT